MIAALSLLAFGLTAAAMPAYIAMSRHRLLDEPGARSSHKVPTPTGGGLPAVLAFVMVSLIAVAIEAVPGGTPFWVSIGCASVLSVLGILDDAADLPVRSRLVVQMLVASAIVYWLGHPMSPLGVPQPLVAAISVIAIVGSINAFNFMDGIDGLVGGTGIVILATLGVLSRNPQWFLLAAAYAGFQVFNLPPARIFMGDAGSTALGGLVAVAVLSGRQHLEARHLLVFLPLIGDATYTVIRRLLRGENVFRAHHSHLYQRLVRAGHTHGQVSGSYVLATLGMGVLVSVGDRAAALIGVAGCLLVIVLLERYLALRAEPFSVEGRRTDRPH